MRFLNSKHQNHLKSLSPKHPPSPLSAKHSQISRKRQQAVGESHMWSKDFFPHARSIHGMTGYQVSRSRKPILGEFCCFPLLFSFSSHHHLTHHTHIFKNNTYFLFHSFCRSEDQVQHDRCQLGLLSHLGLGPLSNPLVAAKL